MIATKDPAKTSSNLYDELLQTTEDYLGPASERFIARQIETHLHKKPQNLTGADLIKLVEWIKLSVALLTEDPKMVDDFSRSLTNLAKKHP